MEKYIALFFFFLFLTACQKTEEKFSAPIPYPENVSTTQQRYRAEPSAQIKIKLPEDEGEHHAITEWWYYTGQLETTDHARYAFLFVIFKILLGNSPVFYTSHLAIAPLDKISSTKNVANAYASEERAFARNQKTVLSPLHGFNFDIQNPKDAYHNLGYPLSPLHLPGGESWQMRGNQGHDKIKAILTQRTYGLDLNLLSSAGITLPANGLLHYVNQDFPSIQYPSYYYQHPIMQVDGKVYDHGQWKKIKSGYVWFDHQWMDFLNNTVGWRWFSIVLDDHSAIMTYETISANRSETHVESQFGFYIPACQPKPCAPNQIRKDTIVFSELPRDIDYWTSPATGIKYPVAWHFHIPSRKGIPDLNLKITRYFPNAEIDARSTLKTTYWEAPTLIEGTKNGKPIKGSGYTEIYPAQ